jgi:methionyl-tRNA formyltransferase
LCDAVGEELAGLSLVRARPAEGEGGRWHDGEIDGAGHISAANGTQAIEILELQPEGKRVMSLGDFRRGHAWMPGMRLTESPPRH